MAGTVNYFNAAYGAFLVFPHDDPDNALTVTSRIDTNLLREWLFNGRGHRLIVERLSMLGTGELVGSASGDPGPDGKPMQMTGSVIIRDQHNVCLMLLWRQPDQAGSAIRKLNH